jgi:pyruvate/2-oxoglutarate dehydrogenase complex dihydrolipoamide dehydrogenase (E3) component
MGARVILLEPGEMGGDCLNYGCVPSKALLSAAARTPKPSYADAMAGVQQAVAAIAPNDSVERFEGLGVHVIKQAGRFIDPRTVETTDGTKIKAKRFVIATGARAFIPPIDGVDDVPYLTNETLWSLTEAPEHLLIIGGGPIGCEMALAHARLGCQVTVVEFASIMPKDDPELVDLLRRRLIAEGIVFREGVSATAVTHDEQGLVMSLSDGSTVSGSHLLIAAGRKANTDSLDCEAAEIVLERGSVKVDERMITTNDKVFAIGDVNGGPQFTHAATYQAGLVIKRALFKMFWTRADHSQMPWVTYTDPELAHIGLTEAMAREKHTDIRILRWPFAENDRAIVTGKTEGLVKVITTPKGRILGCSILSSNAGELILPWCLAIQNRLKIGAMAQVTVPYPTLSEASKRAAGSFYTESLFSPRTRRIVRWLLKLS